MKTRLVFLLAALLGCLGGGLPAFAQGTAFTYQGRLTDNGPPAHAIYDLRFTLYADAADEIEIKKRFGANAQILSSPHAAAGKEQVFYFEDLPPELQQVLRVQLRQRGDVSAVIEMPGGFLLYVAKEKTAERLNVATLSIPKRSYEQWLNEQIESKP